MSAYFLANIRITDDAEYAKYLEGTDAAFAGHGGEYITVAESPVVLEGSWDYSRLVLIRFPDMASLRGWYDSDAYQHILRHRLRGAACDTLLFEGK